MTYRLLDLGCKAGGASMGYHLAGFEVTGVDVEPQPNYPFRFIRADALTVPLDGYDAFAASMPCQRFSAVTRSNPGASERHPDLIGPIRERLQRTGLPYVLENVPGAPLRDPVTLCGSMFRLGSSGYQLVRHREFETWPFEVPALPDSCRSDPRPVVGIYGGKVRNRRAVASGSQRSRVGTTLPLAIGQEAMGIDWMNCSELSQAIPPAYPHYVGLYLRQHLDATSNRNEAA